MKINKWQCKHDNPKPLGLCKSRTKKEVHSNTNLPQETRETLNKQFNFAPNATGKRKFKKPQS